LQTKLTSSLQQAKLYHYLCNKAESLSAGRLQKGWG